jgi:chloramphenicol-sensitive protein RarD
VQETRRGIAYGLAAYVIWGFLTVYWHELSGLSAFELIGQRILWSVLLLVAVLAGTRNWAWVRSLDGRLLARITAAAVLLAANWTSYVWAVTNDNVVETALGYFIAPLGTVLVGVVVLKEHLSRAQVAALSLAALAVVVLTLDYGRVPWIALILGVTWSFYGLLKKQLPLTAIQGLTAETAVLVPLALLVVVVAEAGAGGIGEEASSWQLTLVVLSGVATTVPLLLFAASTRRVPLTTLGPLQYAVPTINFLLGVVVYGEPMPAWRLVGFGLVWVALALVTVEMVRRARRAPLPAYALSD